MKSLAVRSASLCLLLMSCVSARAETTACEVLPASQVTAVTGRPARIQESKEAAAGHCVYRDSEGTTHLRMYSNESEAAARATLQREVTRLEREGVVEHLRGIGSEAQFVAKAKRSEGEIVARYDTTVLVITGTLNQPALVALMRSAIAALSGQPHEEHP